MGMCMGMCVEMCVGMCMGMCMGMCVGDVCGRVYRHVWQCEGMSGCYYCIYMSHIFCKTVKQVGDGVIKKCKNRYLLGSSLTVTTLKKSFSCWRCDCMSTDYTNTLWGVKLAHASELP